MRGGEKKTPRVLFFSGGTALGPVAASLARYAPRSVHLVTPFDSGGSSAELRRVFGMPAVGDLRARILSLADVDRPGNRELTALLARRLDTGAGQPDLRAELVSLASGTHFAQQGLAPLALRETGRLLQGLLAVLPHSMDLRGASVGNLVLAAAYLEAGRRLARAAAKLSALVHARGLVRPVVDADAHLAALLADGTRILGQHRFTGKDIPRITSPIEEIRLIASPENPRPVEPAASSWIRRLIRNADLICFPVGSFYSSVLANLLPRGVSGAVLAAPCPKVFIPNPFPDPELLGHEVRDQVQRLLERLHPGGSPHEGRGLDFVLADTDAAHYPGGLPKAWLQRRGIRLLQAPLITPASDPQFDPERVSAALLHLCGKAEEPRALPRFPPRLP